jgi:hypothetical protein
MEENFVDDFTGILNASFDASAQQHAAEIIESLMKLENFVANKSFSNPSVQELIETLYNYREILNKRIGALVAEKTRSYPPVAEPLSLEKQKIIIKYGVIDNAIEKLTSEIEDLKKENKELEAAIASLA